MYKRLMQFVEDAKANESLANLDLKHRTTMDAINEAERRLQHYRAYQGFQGQTGTAIDKWLADAEQRLQEWRDSYLATAQVEVEMRRVMQHAREEAEMLSPVLVDSRLDALRDMAEVTIPVAQNFGIFGAGVNAVASTGAAVYDAVAAQANAQREANSADILRRLNDSMRELANHARDVKQTSKARKVGTKKTGHVSDYPSVSAPWVAKELENGNKSVSPDDPGVYPGDRGSGYGRSDLRGANSGLYPGGFDDPSAEGADAEQLRKMQSQRIADKFTKEGELGSRSKPITDPQDLMGIDLMHTRIGGERYANGAVGGYTPAPPTDRDHPLWRINGGPSTRFNSSGHLSHAGLAGAGAGVLGAGALGAAALGARGASRLGSGAAGASGGALGSLGRSGTGGLGSLGRSGTGGLGSSGRSGIGGIGGGGRGGIGGGGLSGSGASALRAGSYSGKGFGSYAPPTGTSASGGTTGLTGTNGVGGTAGTAGKAGSSSAAGGAAGAAGRPGMGGFMGAGAGAGAGGGKDDKKGKRRKYTAFKFEDDEDDALPPGYVNPMSQTYGSDKDLKPASPKDDGWDPRQW